MSLRRILTNQIKLVNCGKAQFIRGGHGWDRPDVPVDLNPLYVHRRELSIFDTNMWMYDQVFPEYVISYNEIHLRDQWNGILESLSQSAYFWAIMAFIAGFYYLNASPRQLGWDTNTVNGRIEQYKQQYVKRSGLRNNFIGLDVTGENSIIHPVYDRTIGYKAVIDELSEGVNQRNLINLEAKNFVEKVQKECEKRLLSGHSGAHHH